MTKEIVAIISDAEGFFTRGIITKLEEKSISTVFVGTDIMKLNELKDRLELFVVCVSDGMEQQRKSLVYVKDLAEDLGKKIILIGNPEELKKIDDILPTHSIMKTFTRPLDMNNFLAFVKNYFDNETGENRKKNILIVYCSLD